MVESIFTDFLDLGDKTILIIIPLIVLLNMRIRLQLVELIGLEQVALRLFTSFDVIDILIGSLIARDNIGTCIDYRPLSLEKTGCVFLRGNVSASFGFSILRYRDWFIRKTIIYSALWHRRGFLRLC